MPSSAESWISMTDTPNVFKSGKTHGMVLLPDRESGYRLSRIH